MSDVLERAGRAEDAFDDRLLGEGAKKGSTPFGRAGDVIRRPPAWAAIAALLSATGERGRRAALRGSVCHLSAADVLAGGALGIAVALAVWRLSPPHEEEP